MSLEELAFPVIHHPHGEHRNGHAAASATLRGPLWPASDMWTSAAPKRLRHKTACKTPLKSWARWLDHLSNRKKPRPIQSLVRSQAAALTWGILYDIPELQIDWEATLACAIKEQTKAEKRQAKSAKPRASEAIPASTAADEIQKLLTDWQQSARIADGATEILWAYHAVALARGLPELAQILAAEAWWTLVDALVGAAQDAASLSVVEHPLAAQLLAVELPLTLAYQLPELGSCAELFAPARSALAAGLRELLDGEGVVHENNWGIQRQLFALWTRCRALQAGLPDEVFDAETARHYTLALCELLRAVTAEGGQILGPKTVVARAARDFKELLATAKRFVPDVRQHKAAVKFRRQLAKTAPAEKPETAQQDEAAKPASDEKPRDYDNPSVSSEWAQVAIFRRNWKPRSPLLACSYDKDQVQLEVATEQGTVLRGPWLSLLFVNNQRLSTVTPWREVCQISDNDVDYLELELQLEQGYKIQRQLCLGRKDRFVYLCDSVLGQQVQSLNYMQTVGLANGVTAATDDEMREVTLCGEKPLARVLPLALSEWRSAQQRAGSLEHADASLTQISLVQGRSLSAPLWIDLHPKRLDQPLTWRALTVAENRVICPADVARGWRVQVADRQWIVYRALAERGNRTILGHNLISEFLLARFKDGTTTNLVEIE
jgi:hypothetical protein